MGFVMDKAKLGQVFSEYFSFLCQAFHRLLKGKIKSFIDICEVAPLDHFTH
jgi:hypothetical protein